MKNIFKAVWSCWNKTDRIMAVISTIVLILIICLLFTSCNAQPSHGIIPTPEQYQVNPDEDILDNYIPICRWCSGFHLLHTGWGIYHRV